MNRHRISTLCAIIVTAAVLAISAGCAMWRAQTAIAPPGGCDSCHHQPISADWQVTVTAVQLTDETGRAPWQKESSVFPPMTTPDTSRGITESVCFRCHKGMDASHASYAGNYHH